MFLLRVGGVEDIVRVRPSMGRYYQGFEIAFYGQPLDVTQGGAVEELCWPLVCFIVMGPRE